MKICELADSYNTNSNCNLETKKDNIYSDDIRLCAIELAGQEVAAEKVSPVIQTVLKHLTKIQVPNYDLPNATTSQTIIDEGHNILKSLLLINLKTQKMGIGS